MLHICLHDKKPLSSVKPPSQKKSVKPCHQLYQYGGTWPYSNQPEKHTGLEYIPYYILRFRKSTILYIKI